MRFYSLHFALLTLAMLATTAHGAVVVRNDTFSTNTRSEYTEQSIYFGTPRLSTDWTVSGGVLNVIGGREGMLSIEDNLGNLLPTPNHFRVAFSFDPTTVDTQDHPGIVFDRNGTNARLLYLRTHSNQFVPGLTTSPSTIAFGTVIGTTGLAVTTSYDFLFDVNYLTTTATVSVFPFGGGPLITTAAISGANFTTTFGANTGGSFGLVGFSSEEASIDNLVVTDMTQFVPEPSSLTLLGLGAIGLAIRTRRRRRAA